MANYILEQLANCEGDKRARAEELLETREVDVPTGIWLPPYVTGSMLDGPLEMAMARGVSFFGELDAVFGDSKPRAYEAAKARFQRNSTYMAEFWRGNEQARQERPTHEHPPYCDNFDRAVKEGEVSWDDETIKLGDLTFTTDSAGSGGYGTIYKARAADGRTYALKIFHPLTKVEERSRDQFPDIVRRVIDGIIQNISLIAQHPFLPVHMVSREGGWYVREFIEGESVEAKLRRNDELTKDPKFQGTLLIEHAQLLKRLHSQGYILGDQNWGAWITDGKIFKYGDSDTLGKIDDIEYDSQHPARNAFQPTYGSQEQIRGSPQTFVGEVEALGLLADHLLLGEVWEQDLLSIIRAAGEDDKEYPEERIARLPEPFQILIPEMIAYPRMTDETTLDQFIEAAKKLRDAA